LLKFHKGGSSREAYEDCFQHRQKPTPLKGRRREKELGEDNSAASLPTSLLPVLLTQQYRGPFLSLQKQTRQRASKSPQKAQALRTSRHGAVARFWAASRCVSSFSQFHLPRNLSLTRSHQFCIFHSSTECLCAL